MKMYDNFFKPMIRGLTMLAYSGAFFTLQAATFSPAQLNSATEQWLKQHAESGDKKHSQISRLDDRLKTKTCDEALQFSFAGPVTHLGTVQIRCNSPQPWQLFISVRFSEFSEALLSLRNISSGSVITADMLSVGKVDVKLSRGSIAQHPDQIIGAKVKRSLGAGQVITLQDLCLVCKGDVVTISGLTPGLEVSTVGIALSDGILGEQIRVTNRQSGRQIVAEVVAVKKVAVQM